MRENSDSVSDERIEQRLHREGVQWRLHPQVGVYLFDLQRSRNNLARPLPLDEPTVDGYAVAMEKGVQFPPVIAYRLGVTGKLVIIDGNHRLAAVRRSGRSSVACYEVLTTDTLVIDRLTRTWNLENGLSLDRQFAVDQAVFMARSRGLTAKAAADLFFLRRTDIEHRLMIDELQVRLAREGINSSAISKTHQIKLATIKLDSVLAAAARAVISNGLSTDMTTEMVRLIGAGRSEAAQKTALDEYINRPEVAARMSQTKRGTIPAPPSGIRHGAMATLGRLSAVLQKEPTKLQLYSPEEIVKFIEGVDRVIALGLEWKNKHGQ